MNSNANIIEFLSFHWQSNMAGNSPNANILTGYSGNISNCFQWSDAKTGTIALNITGTTDSPRTTHGWDVYFLRDLQLQLQKNIYQFKIAYGGTSIAPTKMDWYTGGKTITDTEGQWCSAQKNLALTNKATICKYVFLTGGETDAIDNISEVDFLTYLELFINNLKSIYNNPDLMFFNAKLSSNQTAISQGQRTAINNAFNSYALSNNKFHNVTTDNCSVEADLLHYNESGYRQLATNYLVKFNEIVLNP